MLETSSTHSQRPWLSGSTNSNPHSSIPKSMRLASVPSEYSASYYQPYAPFPGPTPYQPVYPHAYAAGWVQAAPQKDAPSSGVYSAGGYTYGIPQPPSSHTSSNGDPFHSSRKRAPSESDHSSNYAHHAPYQRSRNPSLTSIVGVKDRPTVHFESDRLKGSKPNSHSHAPQSKHDPKYSYHSSLRIAPLLIGRTSERPSIDWHVWDKMYNSASRDKNGEFCATDMELEAFDPPVREPIFIKSLPGKSDGFSIAIQRWGAIRVSTRRPGSSITVNDIMHAISLWMMVPIQPEDWKIFDKMFERHVGDAFESRKMYAKTQRPLTGSAKDRAQVVDSLFCRVRWDGMVISDDFAESKTVYLRLKDTSLRC